MAGIRADERRLMRVVAKGVADFVHQRLDVLRLDVRVRPDVFHDLLMRERLTGVLEK